MVDKVMFSHESTEWVTPAELYDRLNEVFKFDLDPCTTKDNPLNAPDFYTKEDDGLKLDWFGNVFVNPPYNQEITKWIQKAIHEMKEGHVNNVVFLLPARTDTKWFHDHIYDVETCDFRNHIENVHFLKGRVKFRFSKYGAPFPSMIVIFSKQK